MTRQASLSGIALAALLIAIAPASAQTVNLLGGSSNGGVSINLGGSGSTSSDGVVGIESGGEGNLLGLGGGSGSIADVDVGGDDGDLLDLDDDGTDAAVDLFGPGENLETRLALGTGSDDDDVVLSLFGPAGSGDTASAAILPGGVGAGGGLIGGNGGSGADVALDLFGPGDDDAGGAAGGGNGADPIQTGSTNGAGDGTEIFGNGAAPAPRPVARNVRVAAAGNPDARAGCFTPDEAQIAHLLGRNSYDGSVTASWSAANEVSIVPVNVCPDAKARLAAAIEADANMDVLRTAVASNAALRARLAPDFDADDVLAVDSNGEALTVYVY